MPQIKKPEQRSFYQNPLAYPDYTEAEVQAVRALVRGAASAHQQKLAIDFIVDAVCCTHDVPYRPTERATCLQLGKVLVGRHLIWLLQVAKVETDPAERDANFEGEGREI
jgi:hypothetical protein